MHTLSCFVFIAASIAMQNVSKHLPFFFLYMRRSSRVLDRILFVVDGRCLSFAGHPTFFSLHLGTIQDALLSPSRA
jgi:hypothetical protein